MEKFLGFVNAYRKYISDAATKMAPLYKILSRDIKFEWTSGLEQAYETLKTDLNRDVKLYLPDFNKEFILTTDASNIGLGYVLEQKSEENGEILALEWGSRIMSPAEQRYLITEKELLGVVEGAKHDGHYLRGRKFTVVIDHKALVALNTEDELGRARLERLQEKLQEYNFTIISQEVEKM